MSHDDEWKSLSISSDSTTPPEKRLHPIWGAVSFFVDAPWPEKVCMPYYDSGEVVLDANGEFFTEYDYENGSAVYKFVEPCQIGYGCSNHFILMPGSTYDAKGRVRSQED